MRQSHVNEVPAPMAAEEFGKRLEQHRHMLMRFFRSKKLDELDCQDLTQDTMERCLRKKADYREQGAFEGWLITMAKNALSRFKRYNEAGKRSGTKCPFTEEDIGAQLINLQRPKPNTDPSLVNALFDNIDRLPADLNHVVVLMGLEHTPEDCAQLLRTTRYTVVKRYKEALKILIAEWRT